MAHRPAARTRRLRAGDRRGAFGPRICRRAFACIGRTIEWRGKDLAEKGIDSRDGRVLIEVDPRYFRPTEVDVLLGDPNKARQRLG